MAQTQAVEPISDRPDHYQLEPQVGRLGPPPSARALQVLSGIVLLVLAGVSLALFFVVSIMIGLI